MLSKRKLRNREHPEHNNIMKAQQFLGEHRQYALDNAVAQLNQSYEYVKDALDRLRKVHAAGHERQAGWG